MRFYKKKIIQTKILIAHPGKHHIYHLISGCIKSGADVKYITPYYYSGISKIFGLIPGLIGKKAKGYMNGCIPNHCIISPFKLVIIKMLSHLISNRIIRDYFDKYVADKLLSGEFDAKVFISLQDYMPKSVSAAKIKGITIWSDQISNQSEQMQQRLKYHMNMYSSSSFEIHNEKENNEILQVSNLITLPSKYTLNGLIGRISKECEIIHIPYGADHNKFKFNKNKNSNEIIILARAQSIRKGGHLFLKALELESPRIIKLITPRKIKIIIMGELDKDLKLLSKQIKLPKQVSIIHGNVPHSEIEKLYNQASFFIMPSLSESSSLACIEAMHTGLPLIITRYCGIDEFVNGKMGYEVDDNVDSVANALHEIFKNENLWGSWGENVKKVAKTLTWEEYENKISEIINTKLC